MVDNGPMVEETLRERVERYLGKTEVAIYSTLALLFTITVLAGIASASKLLWDAIVHWSMLPNLASTKRTADCTDAGGNSAHVAYFHPLSRFSYRTFSGGWADCLHQARASHQSRDGYP